eukprot:150642-Chlamydomonas_euryale.AAC.2
MAAGAAPAPAAARPAAARAGDSSSRGSTTVPLTAASSCAQRPSSSVRESDALAGSARRHGEEGVAGRGATATASSAAVLVMGCARVVARWRMPSSGTAARNASAPPCTNLPSSH